MKMTTPSFRTILPKPDIEPHLIPDQHVPEKPALVLTPRRKRGRKPRHVREALEAALAAGVDRKAAAEWAEMQRDGPQPEDTAAAAAVLASAALAQRASSSCPFCSEPVSSVRKFREHLDTVHRRCRKCPHCSFRSRFGLSLANHLFAKHGEGQGRVKLPCPFCSYESYQV